MQLRLEYEKRERRLLSPLAALAAASEGRKFAEPECDVRTAFQRDRDRIIHSKSFRRLKSKTQVFIAPAGDHYRTRLTHTLEVSQISRTVARALALNEDLVEAIALGHDLGHTPFGHAGEAALQKLTGHFAHNEQSLRVVDVLERRRPEYPGLNLTAEVRDGILCHTGPKHPRTLEGQIVRLCDRIAYLNHDVDDAIRAGIITEEELPAMAVEVLGNSRSQRINTMVKDLVYCSMGKTKICMSDEVSEAAEILRRFLFANVYIGSAAKEEESKVDTLIKMLFQYYLNNPHELTRRLELEQVPDNLHRAAADYIAGMTDSYALYEFQKLFLPEGWSLE
jgi:dGTPase